MNPAFRAFCVPCKRLLIEPCPRPDKRSSRMSAYCIDVAQTAKRWGLEFAWKPEKLHRFGMVAIHKSI